jgi:hypothetical protein
MRRTWRRWQAAPDRLQTGKLSEHYAHSTQGVVIGRWRRWVVDSSAVDGGLGREALDATQPNAAPHGTISRCYSRVLC